MAGRGLNRIPRRDLRAIERKIGEIGAFLQKRRKALDYTQEEFAELIDINVNTVKYVEQGRRIPSLPMLLLLAKALGLDLEFTEKSQKR